MVYLHNFNLMPEDIQFLTPDLSDFDYYFVITIWPVGEDEKDQFIKTISDYRESQSIFYGKSKEYELFDIGFHLRQTEPKEIIKHLNNLNQITTELALEFGKKQLAGQRIGFYNNCLSPTELESTKYLDEVRTLMRYTLNSKKFGNLSYVNEGEMEVYHIFPTSDPKEAVMPQSSLSVNSIIYEFGQKQISKDKFFEVARVLECMWKITPYIDHPNIKVFQREGSDLGIIVARRDCIEQMDICESIKKYPKIDSLTISVSSKDKHDLPVIGYETISDTYRLNFNSLEAKSVMTLPVPKIEPFVKPRHVLVYFSHK